MSETTATEIFDAWLAKSEPEIGREAWWLTDAYPELLAALEDVGCQTRGCGDLKLRGCIRCLALADARKRILEVHGE